ncbi:MAG: hypothetical protein OXC30_05695 [Alphaproteobacteria bacterium]|nr:hypothetical protein [Alphaproteobacteria bacterium]
MSFFIHTIGDRRIEARLNISENTEAALALIVHPDPNLGGKMDNPIVLAMEKAFYDAGFSTLCFNYSTNPNPILTTHGEKTPDFLDISMLIDWAMQERSDFRHFWIAGASFGAYLALQVTMRRPEIVHFVAVSTPLWQNDFSFLAPCPVSGLVVHSKQDETTMVNAVEVWAQRLSQNTKSLVTLKTIADTDHMFSNKLEILQKTIFDYLQTVEHSTGKLIPA